MSTTEKTQQPATPKIANDRNESPELVQRRADGKKGLLWTIECYYRKGPEVLRHVVRNMYWYEVREFQARIWTEGIVRWADPGHATIISPFDIDTVDIEKQKEYFIDLYYK